MKYLLLATALGVLLLWVGIFRVASDRRWRQQQRYRQDRWNRMAAETKFATWLFARPETDEIREGRGMVMLERGPQGVICTAPQALWEKFA